MMGSNLERSSFFRDILNERVKGRSGAWIAFTELNQDALLIGEMTARIIRFP